MDPTDARSDETLATDAARGDRMAFELLVVRYGAHLIAVLERQIGDAHRAHDLAQEVWLKVYRALVRWRPDGSFRSWLFSIALNHARDARRAENRSRVVYLDDFRAPPRSGRTDPRGRAEEHAAIEQALDEVTEPFRTAVVLVDVMQLSYEEAATSLDCRIGTVKSRVNRGRLAFRDAYLRVSGPQHDRGHAAGGHAP